ncbi:ubiquitin carboxyl-terminal hydrolase 48-like isoform X2 [Siphateles boraxobius]|uniref:ubiquitin carboxyl-terminal hydrolase 48-like isoform X2 n=1 Tax=Siphateles boraxobius TaxID=180520 RepID=UPI004064A47F
MREYAQSTVYVRKVIDKKMMIKESAPEFSVSGSNVEDEREEPKIDGEKDPDFSQMIKESAPEFSVSGSDVEDEREEPKIDGEKDPDFSQSEGGAKRQKLNDTVSLSMPAVASASKSGIRRSTRHRKLRGEKALIVSANQTLKELKIQIMHAFSVAPFDQNLSIDGRCLTDDSATLGSLGVIPESIICLKVQLSTVLMGTDTLAVFQNLMTCLYSTSTAFLGLNTWVQRIDKIFFCKVSYAHQGSIY